MRVYVAQNMDGNEDLLSSFEMAKSEVAATWKLAEEVASLLRKTEEENKASQA